MNTSLIGRTLTAAIAIAICSPMTALAQEHQGVDKRERQTAQPVERAGDAASKKNYGDVPADFYQRSWLWNNSDANFKSVKKKLGKKAPRLSVGDFFENSYDKGLQLDKMRGKIVLIDFWATWCGPCIANIPHTNELAEKYYSQGVEVIAVCNTRGSETMTQSASKNKMYVPTAADQDDKTKKAFGVQWWPYYVIIDRNGIVQAAGLKPDKIEEAIESLLKYQPNPKASDDARAGNDNDSENNGIQKAWLEGDGGHRNKLAKITGQTPPALTLTNWINTDALSLSSLQGKVVMLDFWATWCAPCKAAVPHTNELQEKYRDDGLVIIGVCAKRGHETMAETAEKFKIAYPIAADTTGEVVKAYGVNGFPDYYFIDRSGKLRVADCNNRNIEDVIKVLLAEKE